MTPERNEELKNFIRSCQGMKSADILAKIVVDLPGTTIMELEEALADVDSTEFEDDNAVTVDVLALGPDGVEKVGLGLHISKLSKVDQNNVESIQRTLDLFENVFAQQEAWFAAEIKSSIDDYGPISEDNLCHTLVLTDQEAERHRRNLEAAVSLTQQMKVLVGMMGKPMMVKAVGSPS